MGTFSKTRVDSYSREEIIWTDVIAPQCAVTYHQLDVVAHDVELVLHGELAVEVQQNEGHPGETHGGAGQDAAPQGTVEG